MPKKYYREAEVEAALRPYAEDIRSGASDEAIAKRTALSVRIIQRWRLREGLRRPRGVRAKQDAVTYAMGLLGESLEDVKHRTAESVVNGSWHPPVFLTREHIQYNNFLRLLDAGARLLGMSEAELVGALGVSAVNVSQGLQLLQRAAADNFKAGRRCKRCGHGTADIFCSAICEHTSRGTHG